MPVYMEHEKLDSIALSFPLVNRAQQEFSPLFQWGFDHFQRLHPLPGDEDLCDIRDTVRELIFAYTYCPEFTMGWNDARKLAYIGVRVPFSQFQLPR